MQLTRVVPFVINSISAQGRKARKAFQPLQKNDPAEQNPSPSTTKKSARGVSLFPLRANT
jgi:hypothetical protein